MPTLAAGGETLAVDVSSSDDALTVVLDDGRVLSVPLLWFPRLASATPKQRAQWELIGGGVGIHWEGVDEDISVASLLQPEAFMRIAQPSVPSRVASKRVLPPSVRKARSNRSSQRAK